MYCRKYLLILSTAWWKSPISNGNRFWLEFYFYTIKTQFNHRLNPTRELSTQFYLLEPKRMWNISQINNIDNIGR